MFYYKETTLSFLFIALHNSHLSKTVLRKIFLVVDPFYYLSSDLQNMLDLKSENYRGNYCGYYGMTSGYILSKSTPNKFHILSILCHYFMYHSLLVDMGKSLSKF